VSHFSLLVVTTSNPTRAALSEILAPWQEFDSTVTEYVQSVDITQEAREFHEGSSEPFLDYASNFYGYSILEEGEPDLYGAHKHGWVEKTPEGDVKVIQRKNPDARWDWWVIGGRWDKFWTTKSGDKVNVLQKKDADFDSMRAAAEQRAAKNWDEARAVINPHLQGYMSWSDCHQKFGDDISKAREFYRAQPAEVALREAKIWASVEDFLIDRDTYIQNARNTSLTCFALLMGGVWRGRGEMAWFAVVHDENSGWDEEFQEILESIPDDSWLTIVDCHI
jgi:hypothetical protein